MSAPLVREIDALLRRTRDVTVRRGTYQSSTTVGVHGGGVVTVRQWVGRPTGVGAPVLLMWVGGTVVGFGLETT